MLIAVQKIRKNIVSSLFCPGVSLYNFSLILNICYYFFTIFLTLELIFNRDFPPRYLIALLRSSNARIECESGSDRFVRHFPFFCSRFALVYIYFLSARFRLKSIHERNNEFSHIRQFYTKLVT